MAENNIPNIKNNIILIGLTGCGKSSIGRQLALILNYQFIDIDLLIEKKYKKTIAEIFNQNGEEKFRLYEKQAIAELYGINNHVIAVGGGAVIDKDNQENLKKIGKIVWINTPIKKIISAFIRNPNELYKRPLLKDLAQEKNKVLMEQKLTKRLKALLEQRQAIYSNAEIEISTKFLTVNTAACLIKKRVFKNNDE